MLTTLQPTPNLEDQEFILDLLSSGNSESAFSCWGLSGLGDPAATYTTKCTAPSILQACNHPHPASRDIKFLILCSFVQPATEHIRIKWSYLCLFGSVSMKFALLCLCFHWYNLRTTEDFSTESFTTVNTFWFWLKSKRNFTWNPAHVAVGVFSARCSILIAGAKTSGTEYVEKNRFCMLFL
jgi:hypothetical protein